VQHVVGADRVPAAVVALAGRGVESFEGGVADVLALGLAIAAKNPNSRRPGPLGSYVPWRGPASISRTRPWAVR
jgi:hypothetical protein